MFAVCLNATLCVCCGLFVAEDASGSCWYDVISAQVLLPIHFFNSQLRKQVMWRSQNMFQIQILFGSYINLARSVPSCERSFFCVVGSNLEFKVSPFCSCQEESCVISCRGWVVAFHGQSRTLADAPEL